MGGFWFNKAKKGNTRKGIVKIILRMVLSGLKVARKRFL